jgi:hypothetical protein
MRRRQITCARAARINDSKYPSSELGEYVVLAKRHFQYRTIVGRRRAIEVLERAIANLGDSRTMAITRFDKKVDKPIERGGLLLPPAFKNPIRKDVQFRWKEQRNF